MRRIYTPKQAERLRRIALPRLVSQILYYYIRLHLWSKPMIEVSFAVFLSAYQFRTIRICRSVKMIVLYMLKPILITLASSSFRDISIVRKNTFSTGRLGSTYIVISLIEQCLSTIPMCFTHIGSFVTGSSKHISKTNQAVDNAILIIHMTIARHPILLGICTRHQHGTMRAAKRTCTACTIKNDTLLCQSVDIGCMHGVAYSTEYITIRWITP